MNLNASSAKPASVTVLGGTNWTVEVVASNEAYMQAQAHQEAPQPF